MYTVDERDRVVGLDVPPCEGGAPMPVVLCDDLHVLVAYYLNSRYYSNTPSPDPADERSVIVEFSLPWALMFGMPNDEAFEGHPLESRGLRPYGAYLVQDSSWIRQLEKMNSVHPNHDPQYFKKLKHYVFVFHDSTFECVAESFAVSEHRGSPASLVPVMQSRLR